uniref:Uncharacterized protein n=1 Tax=Timema tahoe TaxID=61484 RepID=A0A7R9FHV6_9NEOP|nr:unnamed protein product [Timema tahoe]
MANGEELPPPEDNGFCPWRAEVLFIDALKIVLEVVILLKLATICCTCQESPVFVPFGEVLVGRRSRIPEHYPLLPHLHPYTLVQKAGVILCHIIVGLGECVLKPSIGDVLSDPSSVEELRNSSNTAVPGEQPSALIDLPLFSLEEALQLVGLDEESTQQNTPSNKESFAEQHKAAPPVVVVPSTSEEEGEEKVEKQQQVESDEEPSLLSDMIQTAQFHHPHPHPRAFQAFYKTEPAPAGNSRVDDDDEEDQDNNSLMGQFTLPIASYSQYCSSTS